MIAVIITFFLSNTVVSFDDYSHFCFITYSLLTVFTFLLFLQTKTRIIANKNNDCKKWLEDLFSLITYAEIMLRKSKVSIGSTGNNLRNTIHKRHFIIAFNQIDLLDAKTKVLLQCLICDCGCVIHCISIYISFWGFGYTKIAMFVIVTLMCIEPTLTLASTKPRVFYYIYYINVVDFLCLLLFYFRSPSDDSSIVCWNIYLKT